MRLLREIVHEALNNALEGGYDQSAQPTDEVCVDLISCCAELDDLEVEDIRDHVQTWQNRKNQS